MRSTNIYLNTKQNEHRRATAPTCYPLLPTQEQGRPLALSLAPVGSRFLSVYDAHPKGNERLQATTDTGGTPTGGTQGGGDTLALSCSPLLALALSRSMMHTPKEMNAYRRPPTQEDRDTPDRLAPYRLLPLPTIGDH